MFYIAPMKRAIFLFNLLVLALWIQAKQWKVGPSRTYTKPSQVSALVGNGDTVLIDAGVYNTDVCKWTADNLLLKGVGGFAHLKANGANYGGKAIWVIQGKNNHTDSIEFSLCSCVDQNGAGIRLEGNGLTVSHCYFHDNENGILCGQDTSSDVLIEYSNFENNGFGDGYSHNLYIGHIRTLTFRYNYSHHAKIGHELKSRASKNYILYNRFDEEADGTASRSIDLPNGGLAVVMGNEIIKGASSQNSNFLSFGIEGLTNPGPQAIYIVHNTFVNFRSAGVFVNTPTGVALVKMYNNILSGPGGFTFNSPTSLDTAGNIAASVSAMKFLSNPNREYELGSNSPAINFSVSAGVVGALSLSPAAEYRHPMQIVARNALGKADAGAHEFGNTSTINVESVVQLQVYPNPVSTNLYFRGINGGEIRLINAQDMLVRTYKAESHCQNAELNVSELPPGAYCWIYQSPEILKSGKFIIP